MSSVGWLSNYPTSSPSKAPLLGVGTQKLHSPNGDQGKINEKIRATLWMIATTTQSKWSDP